jgi:hypothetical protein
VFLLTVVSILTLSSICLGGEILHRCVTDDLRVGSNRQNEARISVWLMRDRCATAAGKVRDIGWSVRQ